MRCFENLCSDFHDGRTSVPPGVNKGNILTIISWFLFSFLKKDLFYFHLCDVCVCACVCWSPGGQKMVSGIPGITAVGAGVSKHLTTEPSLQNPF